MRLVGEIGGANAHIVQAYLANFPLYFGAIEDECQESLRLNISVDCLAMISRVCNRSNDGQCELGFFAQVHRH